jgi:vacuolar-type H+-ATPase subunit I/STV1
MQNISTLPLCQDRKNHDKINNLVNYGIIESSHELLESTMPSLEEISVAKAKEALFTKTISPKEALQILKNLETRKEAIRIFEERNRAQKNLEKIIDQLPANITDKPKFHEAKSEPIELSASARETFARIGVRAREAFIEEQVERANLYNIPYESYEDDYYQLMVDIDKYEFLLEKAKDHCVDWDSSEYDIVALEQEIEEAEHNSYLQDQELRFYFSVTRGVEV